MGFSLFIFLITRHLLYLCTTFLSSVSYFLVSFDSLPLLLLSVRVCQERREGVLVLLACCRPGVPWTDGRTASCHAVCAALTLTLCEALWTFRGFLLSGRQWSPWLPLLSPAQMLVNHISRAILWFTLWRFGGYLTLFYCECC